MDFSVQALASVGDSAFPFVVVGLLVAALIVLVVSFIAMRRKDR